MTRIMKTTLLAMSTAINIFLLVVILGKVKIIDRYKHDLYMERAVSHSERSLVVNGVNTTFKASLVDSVNVSRGNDTIYVYVGSAEFKVLVK